VAQNVYAGAHDGRKGKTRAAALLEQLGMTPRRFHRPGQLSAGEKQRTAVARALVNDPKVILADEPTGNLDPDNAAVVIAALRDARDRGKAVVMVTHGTDADAYADTLFRLEQGRLVTGL
jgi:ABC-type lipoprotein export system ATPase subunit